MYAIRSYYVPGDSVVVQLEVDEQELPLVDLEIGRIAHDFTGVLPLLKNAARITSYNVCYTKLLRHPDWYTHDSTGVIVPPVADWTDVADLNYDSKPMRAVMVDAMKFWLTDAGIDGFRCDVAGMVPLDFWNDVV